MAKEMEDQISKIHYSELRDMNGAFLKIRSFCSRDHDIYPDSFIYANVDLMGTVNITVNNKSSGDFCWY